MLRLVQSSALRLSTVRCFASTRSDKSLIDELLAPLEHVKAKSKARAAPKYMRPLPEMQNKLDHKTLERMENAVRARYPVPKGHVRMRNGSNLSLFSSFASSHLFMRLCMHVCVCEQ